MKYGIFVCLLGLLANMLNAEKAYKVHSFSGPQVILHVIEFTSEENRGFELVDVGQSKGRAFVVDQYDTEADLLVINGGYFDGSFRPVGYCMVDGVVLSSDDAERLSGYVVIDSKGSLSLRWKQRPDPKFARDVFQAGLYVIDPGGEIGIRGSSGNAAKRTLIAQKSDGAVLIITTTEVFLDRLAHILKEQIPDIERALNLDGGPSTGLMYQDVRVDNRNPVRNFLKKAR